MRRLESTWGGHAMGARRRGAAKEGDVAPLTP